ncbi:RNA-binding protein 48 [Desmophyllum pertusum]|uniref:RNA-binding protein 48 n=1 Tax=Desmophyllum pertusum TaxID=174260 RepID=A0A9W9Z5H4_9CNID|nr:RNA-binding protein 48 [Desmophyllum pertusum]
MADDMNSSSINSTVEDSSVKKHHKPDTLSYNRPKYRDARWERAVKVYTINLESKFVLVQGVPAVGTTKELLELFALYGTIEEYRILDDYPTEPFTEVYWIKFQRINSARIAKKKLDNRSFFGGILHVCYAPEFETVDDTREKLQERRKVIAKKTRELFGVQQKTSSTKVTPTEESSSKTFPAENKPNPESPIDVHRLQTTVDQTHQYRVQEVNSTPYTMPSSSPFVYPTLPPPPQNVYPYLYPPPPPPWELPRVPSAHATLPAYLQNLAPPPPPPPPPTESPVCDDTKKRKGPGREKPFTVYMSQVMMGPHPEEGTSSNKPSLTGDHSLDNTALSIRNRMHQLSRTHQSAHEISPSPAQDVQLHIIQQQNPGESTTSSVAKKKRKRI